MTVAQRLYLLIAAAVAGLISLVGFNVYQMDKVYTAVNYANINTVPSLLAIAEANTAMGKMRARVWQSMTLTDPDAKNQMDQKIEDAYAETIKPLALYEKEDISDEKDRALLIAARNALEEFHNLALKARELSKSDGKDAARDFMLENQTAAGRVVNAFAELRQYNAGLGKTAAAAAAAMLKNSSWLAIVIALMVVGAVAGMGLMLARKIVNALNEAVGIAQMVAAGDLSAQIDVTSNDEIGQLIQALKDMNDSLQHIVGEVRTGTDTIATAASQIAAGNLDLSSRTEQQAGSLEETASSMEELTSTAKQNVDNARQANQLATSASNVAIKGGAVVSQVVDTMGSINDSSKKIVDIINVIDGIAFQTNILALNAAVEAARAGEQGRGFAVVASEVRNLAQRSAAAAREIKSLIDDSVEKVGIGSKLVDQAGATMLEIVDSVRRVTDVMGEITLASQEQTAGIEQVNQAISQMDQVTQQNAALVEEAAAATASLQDQAGKLAQAVSVFKLDGTPAAAGAPLKDASHSLSLVTPAVRPAPAAMRPAPQVKPLKRVANGAVVDKEWEEF